MITELQKEILRLKKEKDIAILAHSYQSPDIIEIADEVGDSFALSVAATKIPQKTVILCGVKFMGETMKMLSPEKTVIMPNGEATCPMAEQIPPEKIIEFKNEHPEYTVVAYINTTAELKAVCDVCVTSSSALKIVEKIDGPILFIPDKNLGTFIKESFPDKEIMLLDGFCPVHNAVTQADVDKLKALYPDAKLAMHPEIPYEITKSADFIGSTSGIIDYVKSIDDDVIIGTEKSIADFLSIIYPDRKFPLLSKCLMCPDMRITSLSDVLKALKGEGFEIELPKELREKAKISIDAMLSLGK